MYSSQIFPLCGANWAKSQSKTLNFLIVYGNPGPDSKPFFQQFPRSPQNGTITMRDRGKNRKPLQRGRVSTEAIHTVQALKRAKNDPTKLTCVFETKVRRLVKSDLVAVLRELQEQGEGILSLQVFEEFRSEYWYKPRLSVYAGLVSVLASNGLFDKVEQIISYLKKENLAPDTEGFNTLLKTLIEFRIFHSVMECFHLMKGEAFRSRYQNWVHDPECIQDLPSSRALQLSEFSLFSQIMTHFCC
ncbi:protein THYLAKOID ASSEMBLY 8, chloroplastic-like isoform X2 [Aristolochia californica]|uniref:protein THYLAKOID ASSEMBLY 8, chloroplastic-like isoform X2 n=1 Tax=Aristolochia californica TaxID=171875 RepID=UPI0035DFEFBF